MSYEWTKRFKRWIGRESPRVPDPWENKQKSTNPLPGVLGQVDVDEPRVEVVKFSVNPDNPSEGFFELDWNDRFVSKLVRMGYRGTTQQEIVEKWFQDVCRNSAGDLDIDDLNKD